MRPLVLLLTACLLAAGCGGSATGGQQKVSAIFPTASQLFVGSEVRVLGVPVGRVSGLTPLGDVVRVDMEVDGDRPLPSDVQAALVPVTLLGERVIQLDPPYTGGPKFDGGTIPIERTAVPAEVDQVLRSFQEFASALDERVLAELIDTAAETLDGQGEGLNTLVGQGADTIEILADASGELNALVDELGELNATLATRDEKIGRTLERLSVVMQTFAEEKDDIIGSISELRRLTEELRPLVDEHTDPLIDDLEVLTTTLSTVNRNLDQVSDTYAAGKRLTGEFGKRVHDFDDGMVKLNNKGEELVAAIELRLVERLVGLCIRLDIDECGGSSFWRERLPAVTCLSGEVCLQARASLSDALVAALAELPEEGKRKLARDVERRSRQQERAPRRSPDNEEPARPTPLDVPEPTPDRTLPLPDPRLDDLDASLDTSGVSL